MSLRIVTLSTWPIDAVQDRIEKIVEDWDNSLIDDYEAMERVRAAIEEAPEHDDSRSYVQLEGDSEAVHDAATFFGKHVRIVPVSDEVAA